MSSGTAVQRRRAARVPQPMPRNIKPVVVIVGRPNVGKSTLFNRLVGKRVSIVTEIAGTTRDRIAMDVSWGERQFVLVDTAGMDASPTGDLDVKVQAQVRAALDSADLVLLVVDSRTGLLPSDNDMANEVRRSGKPAMLVANKAEDTRQELQAQEFHRLGLGDPILVSAYHNIGSGDLLDRIVACLPPSASVIEAEEGVMRLAIVGRPNVGKSSLLNNIIGEERSVVSAVPGTTRDAIDTPFLYNGQRLTLIDTAGIRRKGLQEGIIEHFSMLRAMQAIQRAEVAVLVLDAQEMVTDQDTHVAGYILDEYKGVIVAVNKWDLSRPLGLESRSTSDFVRERLKFMPYVPVAFVSALTGKGVGELLPMALKIYAERRKRVPDQELRGIMLDAFGAHPPPTVKGKRLSITTVTQSGVAPPEFTFWVNNPDLVHFSYHRFLENSIRRHYGFEGTPIRLVFRKRLIQQT